jgi:hypothetical protein
MLSSKKITCKGTLRNVFICLRPRTPYPPALHTVYVYTVYLFTQGRGGRVEPERRLEGQQFTKLGRKYQHDCLYLHISQVTKEYGWIGPSGFSLLFLDGLGPFCWLYLTMASAHSAGFISRWPRPILLALVRMLSRNTFTNNSYYDFRY